MGVFTVQPSARVGRGMRHARRTDRNHSEIRDGLRAMGFDVCDLSDVGGGVPDLVVRKADHGVPVFLEIKDNLKPPSKQKLRESQEKWRKYCGEITFTVTTLEEAVTHLNGEP